MEEHPISVLYVDDETDLLRIGKLFLEKNEDIRVDIASSAKKALEILPSGSYDAIISDYQMPGMDGIIFLQEVRRSFGDIPFILFTGRGREEIVIQAINNGADFYLQKGGEPKSQFAELAHKIRQAVKRKHTEKELAFKNAVLTTQQEVSPDAILIVDTRGTILGYNQNFVTLWGIPDELLSSREDEQVLQFVSGQPRDSVEFLERVRYLYLHPNEKSYEEILLKDGRTLERFSSPMVGEDGTNFGRVWFFRDITERIQAAHELEQKNQDLAASYEELASSEEELQTQFKELVEREQTIRTNETRLLMAQEIGRTGCWEYNLQTNEIWGSAEGLSIFGFPPVAGDFPIERIEDCILERNRVHQALVDLLTSEKAYDIEYEINPADGSPPRFIHSVAKLEKNADGQIIRVMGVIQDITRRKRRELILKETNEAFVQAQTIARVGSWIYDLKTGDISCSDELFRVFGYKPGSINLNLELISKGIHPDDQKRHEIVLENAIRTGLYEPEEYRVIYPDGSLHYVKANGSAEVDEDGTVLRIIGVCQDFTEEVRLEQEKDSALKQIQKNLAYLAILNDEIRNPLSIIVAYSEMINDDRSMDMITKQVQRIDQMVSQLDLRWMESEKVLNAIRKHYNLHVFPLEEENREKVQDKTHYRTGIDRIKPQDTPRTHEQQSAFLQIIIDTLPVPIFYKNREGVYTGCNTAFERYFGKKRDQVIGKTVYEFWPEKEADIYYKADMSVFESPHIQQYETSMQYADGTIHQVTFYKAPFFDENNQVSGLVGTIIDITEQKRFEESLRESNHKLRLLTGLTRHDILNQLSAVQIFLEMALESSDVSRIHKNITEALLAEEKIEKTIGFTREYEGFGTISAGWYRVSPIIESAIREVTPGDITIENQIPQNLEIYADPIVRKVFTTLLENAIRHGGKITHITFSCLQKSEDLIITCEDDGIGIPKEAKDKIFEHGYGDNTGIGLFLSYEILSITRLSIHETGMEGNGARFEIMVPSGKFRFHHRDISF